MSNISQENLGLSRIHYECAQMNAIWRQTIGNDLGIDGIIEFLEEGKSVSTGLMVGVQVKSGPSYFQHEQGNYYVYYPKKGNVIYWKGYILPVILVLYKPKDGVSDDLCLFTNVKSQITTTENNKILIPKDKIFDQTVREELLKLADMHRVNPDIIRESLSRMKMIKYHFNNQWTNDGPSITGVDLLLAFANVQKGYFEVHVSRIFEMMRIISNENGISYDDHFLVGFIERFMIHLSNFNITEPFWNDFSSFFYKYKIFYDFIVNLTEYGVQLMNYLLENAEEYLELDKFSHLKWEDKNSLFNIISERCEEAVCRYEQRDSSFTIYIP
ncbi:DUF4365 domain-containing protein [Bacillus cereus]|uniref:DUF4365 domain-containing protein n=1 Tax=Bacillus cereus TaxID=1396 RepID=UPI00084BFAEB|nr:DUF4365 domain-containing protein [Bacillus cereus]OED05088.1 hypothetical protein A9756_08455 [Bacillus cereus]